MKPFKVHLRQKIIKDNQASLYLDFSRAVWHEAKGKYTRRDFLELYIYLKPAGKAERDHNRNAMILAESRRAETLLAIQKGTYGKEAKKTNTDDFLAFFQSRADQRLKKTKEAWTSTLGYLKTFTGGKLSFNRVTKNLVYEFKEYLDSLPLAQNSKLCYFSKFKCAIKEANERGLLKENFGLGIKNFPAQQAQRPFLTDDEIRKLLATPFKKCDVLRRATFFSILTSLRWDDIRHLRYEQLRYEDSLGWYIDFGIKKTNRPNRVYLNDDALRWCEYADGKTGLMFPMKYWQKQYLMDWFKEAGIRQEGGFHQFRHSFAMRALNDGIDLLMVSAMMGHTRVSTTQIYAKVLDKNKRDTAHRISLPDTEENV